MQQWICGEKIMDLLNGVRIALSGQWVTLPFHYTPVPKD